MSHGATEKCGNNAVTSEELNSKDVVLSLYDKDYNRTISDRVARSGNETSAPAIAKQLFDELKGGGSRFLARHTKVKAGKTFYKGIACYYSEIDDMGALKSK